MRIIELENITYSPNLVPCDFKANRILKTNRQGRCNLEIHVSRQVSHSQKPHRGICSFVVGALRIAYSAAAGLVCVMYYNTRASSLDSSPATLVLQEIYILQKF